MFTLLRKNKNGFQKCALAGMAVLIMARVGVAGQTGETAAGLATAAGTSTITNVTVDVDAIIREADTGSRTAHFTRTGQTGSGSDPGANPTANPSNAIIQNNWKESVNGNEYDRDPGMYVKSSNFTGDFNTAVFRNNNTTGNDTPFFSGILRITVPSVRQAKAGFSHIPR